MSVATIEAKSSGTSLSESSIGNADTIRFRAPFREIDASHIVQRILKSTARRKTGDAIVMPLVGELSGTGAGPHRPWIGREGRRDRRGRRQS